jgi:hypothetical protein
MIAFVRSLMLPLMILNVVGAIVAMVWLVVLDQWVTLGIGIALLLFTTLALCLALMPWLFLAAPAALLYDKGQRVLALLFGGLALLYVYGLITAWCVAVLWYSMERVTIANLLIPTFLWSFGVAIGPWAYIASKEDGLGSSFTIFFAQVGYLTTGLMILLGHPSFSDVMGAFIVVMSIGLIISLIFVGETSRRANVPDSEFVIPPSFDASTLTSELHPGE